MYIMTYDWKVWACIFVVTIFKVVFFSELYGKPSNSEKWHVQTCHTIKTEPLCSIGTYVLSYYTNVYFANGIKNGVSKMWNP